MTVINFPGKPYPLKRLVSTREIYDSPMPPDELIWETCIYTRGNNQFECIGCPEWEHDERFGKIKRGCRALAEEACKTILVLNEKLKEKKDV